MIDAEPTTSSPDVYLSRIERHVGRILAAGALVSGNLILVAVIDHLYGTELVGPMLIAGLAVAGFLLLHRSTTRMMRATINTARREAQVARQMMNAVEQIGSEGAGVRGTVEALAMSAQVAGLEVYMYEAADRSLWSPAWGHQVSLTPAEDRALQSVLSTRSSARIVDLGEALSAIPTCVLAGVGAQALLVAPMWNGEECNGMVLRRYSSMNELSRANDQALVAAIAAIGAVAIGKALIVDREQQRVRDNELLIRSVHAASESRQRDQLTHHVQQAAEAIRTERAALFTADAGRLRVACAVGIRRVSASGAGTVRLRSQFGELMRFSGTDPLSISVGTLDDATRIVLERLGFGSDIVVQSLCDASGIAGMIVLDSPQCVIDDGAWRLLSAVGRQASSSIERSRMLRSIQKRSRHLACTPKLARSLTGQRDPEAIVRTAARELHDGFGFERVTIALKSEDSREGCLRVVASAGAVSSPVQPVATHDCSDAMRECVTTGRPYVAIAGDEDNGAPYRGQILVPISGHNREVVGAIAVFEQDPEMLGEDDLHMLETIADQLGGAIEQAGLFASLERSYFETVEALSSALEAKDAYTLDHARSITDMSAEVGRRLGMREDEIRDLKLGALLHDIGKIGIPNEILLKPGALTDEEFELMKDHTIIGERIIADVEFLQGVRPLVLHEHERWDGKGYPLQLKGEAIPLGARIIFVCDSWHAMTSDRPYRSALPEHEALLRLREASGTQFDPAVVEAFCELMQETPQGLLAY